MHTDSRLLSVFHTEDQNTSFCVNDNFTESDLDFSQLQPLSVLNIEQKISSTSRIEFQESEPIFKFWVLFKDIYRSSSPKFRVWISNLDVLGQQKFYLINRFKAKMENLQSRQEMQEFSHSRLVILKAYDKYINKKKKSKNVKKPCSNNRGKKNKSKKPTKKKLSLAKKIQKKITNLNQKNSTKKIIQDNKKQKNGIQNEKKDLQKKIIENQQLVDIFLDIELLEKSIAFKFNFFDEIQINNNEILNYLEDIKQRTNENQILLQQN